MGDHATKGDNDGHGAPPVPRASRLVRFLVHLPNFVKLYQRLFADPRVPIWAKAVLVAGVVYVVWPADILPIFPAVSWIDDAVVGLAALWAFPRLCPRKVVEQHVAAIDRGL
ncbi:MAG: hypothetical protein ACE5O2_13305 [Armatimonadota bacterium]